MLNSSNTEKVEKIIKENDNIIMTSYVDSYNNLVVEYPVFYFEEDVAAYSLGVTNSVKNPHVSIDTILGDSMYIYYPADDDYDGNYISAKDFYDNYFLAKISTYSDLVQYLAYGGISSNCRECTLINNEHVGSYEFNNLKWEKYEIEIGNNTLKQNYELWITMVNNIPYIIKFDMLNNDEKPWNESYVPISNSLWEKIVDNSELIRQYIIQNIKLVDNKEEK